MVCDNKLRTALSRFLHDRFCHIERTKHARDLLRTIAAQQADTESLWHTVRSILHVKGECDALRSGATFHAIERDRVFVFERSTHLQKLIIAVNPSRDCKALQLPDGSYRTIFSIGENEISGTSLRLGLQSFAILEAE